MDNNNSNLNTESWEYSLEAILAEYAARPVPETPQRPETQRSREIVMEALSERIAASVQRSADFPEDIAPRRAKHSLFRHNDAANAPEPEAGDAPEPVSDEPVHSAAPEAAPVEPAETPAAKHLPVTPKAQPPKGATIFNIADIIAEVRAAEAAEAEAAAKAEAEAAAKAEAEAAAKAEAEAAARAEAEAAAKAEAEAAAETEQADEADESGLESAPEVVPEAAPEAVQENETEDRISTLAEAVARAVEFSDDGDGVYARADDYAAEAEAVEAGLSETESAEADARPKKKRPSLLTALVATLLVRRQQKQEKARVRAAAAAEEIAEAAQTPEVSAKAASKYYLKSATPYKMRCFVSALLCLVLLYVSWGLPLAGAMKNIRVCAGMCMVLELTVMLLGLDVFTNGLMSLFRGRPSLNSLASVSCIFSVLDALIIMLGGRQHGLPYCAVSAVTLCLALLGERLLCMGHARSFHTAAAAKTPSVITSEQGILKGDSVLLKSERGTEGFVNRAQEADAVELSYSALAPILLVAAPVLAFIATVCRKQAGDFFHCLSALTAVSASFSAFLSFTLPYNVAAKRLSSVGAAVAGWAGCMDLGESRRIVVTDGDVFPEGNVLIDTIRILEGVYTDKVISYAGSVIAFSGSGLRGAFNELMRRNGCSLQQVENFSCHRGGGLTAIVRGEQVFVGNSSFMNLMGIRLPQSQMANTSVFVAISGELVGVFSIRYTPTASVQEALVSLMRGRGTEPLFAIRDFNVTPHLIKQRFRMPTEGFEFPSFPERYRISGLSADEKNLPAAVTVRRGLGPYVEAAQTGRSLYRGSRICLLLSLICSVAGMILMFFLCASGAYDSAGVGNILLYLFLWLVPVAAVSLGLRR